MQNHNGSRTADRARGRWYEILSKLGIPSQYLRGKHKHGPCPICQEGKDRYRWDDKDENGTYFCNVCGAGNGFSLLMKYKCWDFKKAAREVDNILNNNVCWLVTKSSKKENDPRIALRKVFNSAKKLKEGGFAHKYLIGCGLTVPLEDLDCIMENDNLYCEDGIYLPAMLGLVKSDDGRDVSIQRIFIKNKNEAVGNPGKNTYKKTMSPIGTINGASVRIFPIAEHIGISEGITTAIAAHEIFKISVWSVLSTNGMKTFVPPKGIKRITFFGDNDKNFAGQSAAYSGANRLYLKGFEVDVKIPELPGMDWLDVLVSKRSEPKKQYELIK